MAFLLKKYWLKIQLKYKFLNDMYVIGSVRVKYVYMYQQGVYNNPTSLSQV